jgi:hypothetical protein
MTAFEFDRRAVLAMGAAFMVSGAHRAMAADGDFLWRATADETVGRSEAPRRSMVALIEHGEFQEAHPAFWAPFVVVREGGSLSATGQLWLRRLRQRKNARSLRFKGNDSWKVEIWKRQ